jgi:nucleoside-diphosphate-sugar epimerase
MTGISQAKVLRRTAFVTGATGLFGNNLVRALVARGVTVRALVRSRSKAEKQFPSLSMELVEGDINDPPSFARWLAGADIVFHTAAYFRDNYKGGRHWQQLYTTNVVGRARLLSAAYDAGVRRFVQTSSTGTWQQTLNEESEADKKLTAILKARSMRVLSAREASNQPRIAFLGARISPRSGWIDRIECEFREDLYRNERLDV